MTRDARGLRSVGIVGGGTAGYFTALALKRERPTLRVVLIESSAIPIIGVGEATTPILVPFLIHQLGIDIHEFHRLVKPTWKLGIKFEWGLPGDSHFNYAFGRGNLLEALHYSADARTYSLTSMLMTENKGLILQETNGTWQSLMPQQVFAYHLDNKRFVHYLKAYAERLGVEHLDATIAGVQLDETGQQVSHLISSDGQRLAFDLFIDCSGFRSLLMGKSLRSPFHSYDGSLFCDTAVVASVAHGGFIKPYTLAETMSNGWCWNIPQEEEDHRGYVFSSAFCSLEGAVAEMRAKIPSMGEHWTVKFRSGRHADFWKGNVVAIGNAYAFVEPLESTALHMVIVEIARLLRALEDDEPDREYCNRRIAGHWDHLRWFLAVHYRFNLKGESPFWRACRESVDVSGLQDEIDRFREHGLLSYQTDYPPNSQDAIFGVAGLDLLLAAQGVKFGDSKPRLERGLWNERLKLDRGRSSRALFQRRALQLLTERPELLEEFAHSPDSWCTSMAGVSGRIGIW